jgi:hypothetical protein
MTLLHSTGYAYRWAPYSIKIWAAVQVRKWRHAVLAQASSPALGRAISACRPHGSWRMIEPWFYRRRGEFPERGVSMAPQKLCDAVQVM